MREGAPMNVTVIGATGKTGRMVVAEGLARGHAITAFTSRPGQLEHHARLAGVVESDGRDLAAVSRAVDGADAVISTVPGGPRNDPYRAAEVTRTITVAMTAVGAERLVVTSVYPIVATEPRLALALLRRLFATPYADIAEVEKIVSASPLAWTIVRLNRLTNGAPTGRIRVDRELLSRPRAICRADVATVLLDIVENGLHQRMAVNVDARR
jgi:putative NADH-flavin reductase